MKGEVKKMEQNSLLVEGPNGRSAMIPKVTVLFNNIITAAHSVGMVGKIIDKTLSTKQVVVVAGENASVEVGDWIEINVDLFPKERKPGKNDVGENVIIHPPLDKIGETSYMFLTDRHVKYIYNK